MTWQERARQNQAEHEAAGLGEAPSFETMMDRLTEQAVTLRMRRIMAAGQYAGGFMGTGTYGTSEGRHGGGYHTR